ncbi:FCD domain-containing protein [Micromonospora sp. STR1s_5]|nr:FCD domain-containing protein [Micromonospora sp. STR1s_5]
MRMTARSGWSSSGSTARCRASRTSQPVPHTSSRRLSISKAFPSRHVPAEHQAILEAVLATDADRAVSLLSCHYQRTAEVILDDELAFDGSV